MEKAKNLEENRYMQCCYKRCTLLWLFHLYFFVSSQGRSCSPSILHPWGGKCPSVLRMHYLLRSSRCLPSRFLTCLTGRRRLLAWNENILTFEKQAKSCF